MPADSCPALRRLARSLRHIIRHGWRRSAFFPASGMHRFTQKYCFPDGVPNRARASLRRMSFHKSYGILLLYRATALLRTYMRAHSLSLPVVSTTQTLAMGKGNRVVHNLLLAVVLPEQVIAPVPSMSYPAGECRGVHLYR